MVDSAVRAEICEAIDDYLNDRLSDDAFDERLMEISTTEDAAARIIIGLLYGAHGDTDKLVSLDKQSWDTIQRLKLLLQSGCDLRSEQRRVWHLSQPIAAITLIIVLVAIVAFCSVDLKLWPIPTLVAGVVSVALSKWRDRIKSAAKTPDPWRAWPFSSPRSIARALSRVNDFRKQRYRQELIERGIRASAEERAHGYLALLARCLFSPVPLFFQCLPISVSHFSVREPGNPLIDAA